jgi:RNA polymerase sigma-70 factor, ECF subfamily
VKVAVAGRPRAAVAGARNPLRAPVSRQAGEAAAVVAVDDRHPGAKLGSADVAPVARVDVGQQPVVAVADVAGAGVGRPSAEEVVQETWCTVVAGIDRFEGRSSLKTWLMRILTNRAKTCGERERRAVPFSAFASHEGEDKPAVAPERFPSLENPRGR